ncbi:MAG: DUF72 domain-containing protein [Acidimicrobiales bacterium]|nr:DUF72 domain-containing protein [Acidimicrobiales bacterium]MBO0886031.1 DUF72 domain-containing protein [Acidimicrobiales bacterium]
MGEVRVGTASWTDRTLVQSGWYPKDADTAEKRLKFYAEQFSLVEVDATYYSLPFERTSTQWVERTPDHFVFNIKAFSLLTQHPTRPSSLPTDIRPEAEKLEKRNVYLKDLHEELVDELWDRFLDGLSPLVEAGKLGAILFQFPEWFPISRANKAYLVHCAERVAPRRICVEFRNHTWMTEDNQRETLEFLSSHDLPYVCVDMPQGYPSSIPPVTAATSDLAVVRFHGHSKAWNSRDIHERFGYLYKEDELKEWAPRVRRLSGEAGRTHVLMNNCYRDFAQVNARQLADLLGD